MTQQLTEQAFIQQYDVHKYERPSMTVDVLVFTVADQESDNYRKLPEKALKLLLIKRGAHPFMGCWALPGGFVHMNESLEDGAKRELKEETNLEEPYLEQLYTWGDVGRDPRTRVISTSYMALVKSEDRELKAQDDADAAEWFTVSMKLKEERRIHTQTGLTIEKTFLLTLVNLEITLACTVKSRNIIEANHRHHEWLMEDSGGIAFDHGKIIAYGLERLRQKLNYTDIGFSLMPEYFTLTQLQQVYETILDEPLLKANFRRKIAGQVIETGKITTEGGHRPSQLFKFNPYWEESNVPKP